MKIAVSKNGKTVNNRQKSHLHKGVEKWLRIAIENTNLEKDFEIVQYNFPYIIGKSYCVPTTEKDVIYWKKRQYRKEKSRFVADRKPIATSWLTFIIKKTENNQYICLTSFIGTPAPPEVWDTKALSNNPKGLDFALIESAKFWENHALIEEK